MIKEQIKKVTYDCIKGIKNGNPSAHDEYLDRLKRLREYIDEVIFKDYACNVFLQFEEWGLKGTINNEQLKLMWDGLNGQYEAELNKVAEEI